MPSSTGTTPLHKRPARGRAALTSDPLWYKDAVIYEVRTRSFYDDNGDGVGDLAGLTSKLDYLADLGVTALWILPHYPSPGRDDGYDIADYTDVHPDVGTLEDFDALIAQAHRRGIRVITELVLNHTSDQHPWFQRARRAPPGSPERDFYVWSDTPARYSDARIIFRDFEPSNWTYDHVAQAYFWHRFFAHQPDLNFENPAVHEAMLGVVDFWMSRGVDALRLDAVPYLYEAEGTNCENLPQTHAFLKKLRAHVDAKFPGRMLLAEANQWPEDAAAYFGDGDECHMNFHFPIMPRLFMAIHMEDRFPILDILQQTPELHPSCQWAMFLRNHDELTLEMVTEDERDYMYRVYAHETPMRINLGIRRRLAPLTGNDRRRMELLNGLLFSMPGTPVLYYGDEIGMGDNVYLGDRNGVRTPMQWSADRNAGFSRANPQKLILPIIIDPEYHYEALNVEAQQSNPNSLLWWTKRLIALRKRFRAFGRGSVEFLHPSNPRVLAFVRRFEGEVVLVVANLSRHVQYVELDLSSMKGQIPVELMGRTKFPAVGDVPYLLTLGGHDFYWFSLELPRGASSELRLSDVGPVGVSCASVDALLFGDERPSLEDLLPSYLDARGWLGPRTAVTGARVLDAVRVPRSGAPDSPLVLLHVRVDYNEGEADTFVLPVMHAPISAGASAHTVALLQIEGGAEGSPSLLIEAPPEIVGRAILEVFGTGKVLPSTGAKTSAVFAPGEAAENLEPQADARVVSSDRLGSCVALGSTLVKIYHRMEEGTAPEVEVARHLTRAGVSHLTPRGIGALEYRAPRAEPVTLAVLEEYVTHESSAWQHARDELGRAYERALARMADAPLEDAPPCPLTEAAFMDPPASLAEFVGPYRDWAALIGRRVAELHLALARSNEPAFEPQAYSTMDQRSKYQSARNLVGRVVASLRLALPGLDPRTREDGERLLAAEAKLFARFEALLAHRIDATQIRHHGEMHLGRLLFTGKDFVVIGVGTDRDQRLSERRRKGSSIRDVAAVMRSFHYAAAMSLRALRPEDQGVAEPLSWSWPRWASAAALRGYLDTAREGGASFLPTSPATLAMLVETTMAEKALVELAKELRGRPEAAWIPLGALLRLLG